MDNKQAQIDAELESLRLLSDDEVKGLIEQQKDVINRYKQSAKCKQGMAFKRRKQRETQERRHLRTTIKALTTKG